MNGNAAAQGGFTLLEMLVALAVFSIVAVMSYRGLDAVATARAGAGTATARLVALQRSVLFFERDLEQLIGRPVRDGHGTVRAAVIGTEHAGGAALEFTHAGWDNPAGRDRSNLQRVRYRYDRAEASLVRESWGVLDLAPDSSPTSQSLVPGLRGAGFRFMDGNGIWREDWPARAQDLDILPRAIELTLIVDRLGEIRRLFPLAVSTPVH